MSYFHYDQTDMEARRSGEDLTRSQFHAVRRLPDGTIGRAIAGDSIGILHNNPNVGQHATYQIAAICPAVCAAAFPNSSKLTTNASGQMVVAAPGGAYQYVAQQESIGPNDIVAVKRESGVRPV